MAGETVENEVVNNNSVPDDLQVEPVNAPVDVAVPNDMLGARRPSLVDDAESSSDSRSSISLDEVELSEYEDTAIKEEYNRPSLTSSTRCINGIENTADEGEPSSAEGRSEQCLSLGLNTAQIDDWAYRPGCHAELLAIQVATSVLNDTPPHVPVQIERPAGLLMIAQPQNFYPNLNESTEDDYQNFSEMLIRNGASYARAGHVVNGSAFCEYRRPPAAQVQENHHENVPSNGGMEVSIPPLEGRASTPLERQNNFGRQIYFTPLTVLTAVASGSSKSEEEPKKYKDGTTFQVDSSLQKVEYKRSEDGCLYRNTASGVKVYREFKESGSSSQNQAGQNTKEKFTVKYLIDKVDKACQTGEDSAEQLDFMGIANLYQLSEVVSIGELLGDLVGQLPLGPLEETDAEEHSDFTEPGDAVKISDEVDWSCTPKSSNVFCKHCNNQHPWPGNLPKELNVGSNERSLKEIWGGTEMCGACPWSSKPPTPLEETTSKLREESREEADQLLSDLNSLQLSNVTELKVWQPIKRRHSQTDNLINDDWSFASLLQEDFLGSLPALPARRPVRL